MGISGDNLISRHGLASFEQTRLVEWLTVVPILCCFSRSTERDHCGPRTPSLLQVPCDLLGGDARDHDNAPGLKICQTRLRQTFYLITTLPA
jgi:hypothetical protein